MFCRLSQEQGRDLSLFHACSQSMTPRISLICLQERKLDRPHDRRSSSISRSQACLYTLIMDGPQHQAI
jgi:hypothetical protein